MPWWFVVSILLSPTSGISPSVIPPNLPVPTVPPCNRPQCVMLPSLCLCVLIVQHPPMSENMWCLVFCSCVSLLRMMVSRFIHVPTKDMDSLFSYGCIVFCGICATFSLSSLSLMGIWVGPGLCFCKQCHDEHTCACVFIIEQFIILWVYTW